MNFFGFDSFEGFGELGEDDAHTFYTDVNFKTDYNRVLNRVKKVNKDINFKLVKGFFNETLSVGPQVYNIQKARIIFIDSDTYSSSRYEKFSLMAWEVESLWFLKFNLTRSRDFSWDCGLSVRFGKRNPLMETDLIKQFFPIELLDHFEYRSSPIKMGEHGEYLEVEFEEKNELPQGYSREDYESKDFLVRRVYAAMRSFSSFGAAGGDTRRPERPFQGI